jgi:pimeloyl-ACP methyl ester carboxylesterase
MKLAQRIVVRYYQAKFKALAHLSPAKAATMAFDLFCTPQNGKARRKAPPVFHQAQKIHLMFHNKRVKGFHWKGAHPSAGTVLICHGFNSCSYRFDAYVQALLHRGFDVLAFDAPGHGTSDGRRINVLWYRDIIVQIDRQFGPLHGILAHSLGGLAAALAAETLQQHLRLALVAPASETSTAIAQFFHFLRLDKRIIPFFIRHIEAVGKHPVSWFSVNRAIRQVQHPVLWIHDENDLICPYADTAPSREQPPAHLRFVTTKHLGHNKIYHDPDVAATIVDFLAGTD